MGASTEKKNRRNDRENGIDRRSKAAIEAEEKAAKYNRNVKIIAITTAVVIVLVLFLSSGFLYTGPTAVKIGDRSFTAGEMNYYYAGQYANFANTYGEYASMFGLDTSNGITGLDSQECAMLGEGKTWRDYFLQSAETSAQKVCALTDWAKENNVTLSEDTLAEINAQLGYINQMANLGGYGNGSKYLASYYGNGVDTKVYEESLKEAYLAEQAIDVKTESLEYTDAELKDYYSSRKDDFDVFDYAYYYVAAETVEVAAESEDGEATNETTPDTMEKAKADADAIAAAFAEAEGAGTLEKLNAAVASVVPDAAATNASGTPGASVIKSYADWVRDSARADGDVTVIENTGNGYYVVAFMGRSDNSYPTAMVRHILVKAVADENGTFTDEAKAEAKAKAEEIYADWQSQGSSEAAFIELAKAKSEDTGSAADGGLYDAVYKGQMVKEFNDFCFAEGRKPGDTAIVYGESASYAGYHVMYYVGQGDLYCNCLASDEMTAKAMDEWNEEILANYPITEKFALKFVG